MENLQQEIDLLLKHEVVTRHTFFQLKHFLIDNQPTLQAQLWQCLTELQVRNNDIKAIKLQIDESNDHKELLDIEIEKIILANMGDKERAIRIRQVNRQKVGLDDTIKSLQQKLKFAEEEAEFFVKYFKTLEEREPLRAKDDLQAQLEYWNLKLKRELELNLLTGKLDVEVIKTILSLPDDQLVKKETLQFFEKMKDQHKKIEAK